MGQIKSKAMKESFEAKHSTTTGLYPKCSWPAKTIKKLICDKKLSPIFKGVEEPTPGVEMDECPICFLSYPMGLNRSRCCRQEICTECFLQIKETPGTICDCPFCNQNDFGVVYMGPKSRAERQTEKEDLRKVEEVQQRMREEEIKKDKERLKQQEKDKQEKELRMQEGNASDLSESDDSISESEASKTESETESDHEGEPQIPDAQVAVDFNEMLANNHNPAELEDLMIMEAIRLSLVEGNGS